MEVLERGEHGRRASSRGARCGEPPKRGGVLSGIESPHRCQDRAAKSPSLAVGLRLHTLSNRRRNGSGIQILKWTRIWIRSSRLLRALGRGFRSDRLRP